MSGRIANCPVCLENCYCCVLPCHKDHLLCPDCIPRLEKRACTLCREPFSIDMMYNTAPKRPQRREFFGQMDECEYIVEQSYKRIREAFR